MEETAVRSEATTTTNGCHHRPSRRVPMLFLLLLDVVVVVLVVVLLPVPSAALSAPLPPGLRKQLEAVVLGELFRNETVPVCVVGERTSSSCEGGEALWELPPEEYGNRLAVFEAAARKGDPAAQHSAGLLRWSGFCGTPRDAVASARWHGAAAWQGHTDAIAVLGGCLRKGAGCRRNPELGLALIEHSARQGNPTGANKRAAIEEEEEDGNDAVAFGILAECHGRGAANALLLLNLGYYLCHGQGTARDDSRGEDLWREAAARAPDQGSEEAAWMLYLRLQRDHPKEAMGFLELAAALGYPEAVEELEGIPEYLR